MPMLTRLGRSGRWSSVKPHNMTTHSYFQEKTLKEYLRACLLYEMSIHFLNKDFIHYSHLNTADYYTTHDLWYQFSEAVFVG